MGALCKNIKFLVFVLIIAGAFHILPVLAAADTVTIAFRGSEGNNIGDRITFDGKNTAGNLTLIKITGPGLPLAGVPPNDLTGITGSGNTVYVDTDGTWTFIWDSSRIKGADLLQKGRYTFIASDLVHQEKNATSSILLKKPDFYIMMVPNPANINDYVQVSGYTEQYVPYIKINIIDSSGAVLRTLMASESADGHFSYNFHVDMQPGQYSVVGTNPSLKDALKTTLKITSPLATTPDQTPSMGEFGTISVSSSPSDANIYLDSLFKGKTPAILSNVPAGTHTLEIRTDGYKPHSEEVTVKAGQTAVVSVVMPRSPIGAPLSPVTAIFGLILAGAIILFSLSERRII